MSTGTCPNLPTVPTHSRIWDPSGKGPRQEIQPAPSGNFRDCPDSTLAYAGDTPRQLKASENHKLLRLQGFWASLTTSLMNEPKRGKINHFNRETALHLAAKQTNKKKKAFFLPLWQWISCTWTGMAARFYSNAGTKPCWRGTEDKWHFTSLTKVKIILYQNSNSSGISRSYITVSGYILEF